MTYTIADNKVNKLLMMDRQVGPDRRPALRYRWWSNLFMSKSSELILHCL